MVHNATLQGSVRRWRRYGKRSVHELAGKEAIAGSRRVDVEDVIAVIHRDNGTGVVGAVAGERNVVGSEAADVVRASAVATDKDVGFGHGDSCGTRVGCVRWQDGGFPGDRQVALRSRETGCGDAVELERIQR